MRASRLLRRAALAAVGALGAACASNAYLVTMVGPFGIDAGVQHPDAAARAKGAMACGGEQPTDYWSARVFLESRNLPRVAGSNDDFLITSLVTIPLRSGTRTFEAPLFLVRNGAIEAQGGADLLHHVPVAANARDQLSLRFAIKRIANANLARQVHDVLQGAQDVAGTLPTTPATPMSLTIADTSGKIIDRLLANAEEKPPSSMTIWLDTTELARYVDRPVAFAILPASGKGAPGAVTFGDWENCSDRPTAMCQRQDSGAAALRYESDRVSSAFYLTLSVTAASSVFDENVKVAELADCSDVSKERVDAVRSYLAKNEDLFSRCEVRGVEEALREAEQYLSLRQLSATSNMGGLLDLLDESWPPTSSNAGPERQMIEKCERKEWQQFPAQTAFLAYEKLVDAPLRSDAGTPKQELDTYGTVLSLVASTSGHAFEASKRQNLGDGRVLSMLVNRAYALEQQQLAEISSTTDPSRIDCKKTAASPVSAFCDECLTKIRVARCNEVSLPDQATTQSAVRAALLRSSSLIDGDGGAPPTTSGGF